MCTLISKIVFVFVAKVEQKITLSPWQNYDSNKTSGMYKWFEQVINKSGVGKYGSNKSDNTINYSSCW